MSKKDETQDQKGAPHIPLQISAQYVRDISFENPMAPQALRRGMAPPKTKVDFAMDMRELKGEDLKNMYEVILSVRAEAHRDNQTVFIAEVQYGTVVSLIAEVTEEQKNMLLMIEVPRLAFPYVRQIISTLAIQGGYPPLLLHPVNFHALYMERIAGKGKTPEQAGESKKESKKKKKAKG